MKPELIILKKLKDLPAGVGMLQISSARTPEEDLKCAEEYKARKVYFYEGKTGHRYAFIVTPSASSQKKES